MRRIVGERKGLLNQQYRKQDEPRAGSRDTRLECFSGLREPGEGIKNCRQMALKIRLNFLQYHLVIDEPGRPCCLRTSTESYHVEVGGLYNGEGA